MRTRAFVVMAEEPTAGEVKTRFVPEKTGKASERLYICFIRDIFELTGAMINPDYYISYYKENADEVMSKTVTDSLKLRPGKGINTGKRFRDIFAELFKGNYREVIIMDSGIPQLPMGYIDKAFELLEENDVVIGPSLDGDYQVIGLSTFREDIFEGIAWNQGIILEEMLERIEDANLRVAVLPQWDEANTISGWYRVLKELKR
ncbi:MAG TPA: DUF2064 domain-containing protein [Anaerolineae bacterium]|nr:DUF2064 domain-containing protein [Anaerolineae bacterium]